MAKPKKENKAERQARERLERAGFHVEPIPERPGVQKTADCRVSDSSSEYIIEVKSKQEAHEFSNELEAKGVACKSHKLTPNRIFSDIIDEATCQLQKTQRTSNAYLIIWFAPNLLIGSDFTCEQMVATLLGIQEVSFGNTMEKVILSKNKKKVLYYHDPIFLKYRDSIDAVIIAGEEDEIFVINPFGQNIQNLQNTMLYEHYYSRGRVCNSNEIAASGKVFVVDPDFPRNDPKAVYQHIKNKYNIKFMQPTISSWFGGLVGVDLSKPTIQTGDQP